MGDGSIVGIHRSGWVNALRANSLFLHFLLSLFPRTVITYIRSLLEPESIWKLSGGEARVLSL